MAPAALSCAEALLPGRHGGARGVVTYFSVPYGDRQSVAIATCCPENLPLEGRLESSCPALPAGGGPVAY